MPHTLFQKRIRFFSQSFDEIPTPTKSNSQAPAAVQPLPCREPKLIIFPHNSDDTKYKTQKTALRNVPETFRSNPQTPYIMGQGGANTITCLVFRSCHLYFVLLLPLLLPLLRRFCILVSEATDTCLRLSFSFLSTFTFRASSGALYNFPLLMFVHHYETKVETLQ